MFAGELARWDSTAGMTMEVVGAGGDNNADTVDGDDENQNTSKEIYTTPLLTEKKDKNSGEIPRITSLDMLHMYISSQGLKNSPNCEPGSGSTTAVNSSIALTPPGLGIDDKAMMATESNVTSLQQANFQQGTPLQSGVPILIHKDAQGAQAKSMIPDGLVGHLDNDNPTPSNPANVMFPVPATALGNGLDDNSHAASNNDHAEKWKEGDNKQEQQQCSSQDLIQKEASHKNEKNINSMKRKRCSESSIDKNSKQSKKTENQGGCTETAQSNRAQDRKARRMKSNRESARRSRLRKQQHMQEIEYSLSRVTAERDNLLQVVARLTSENKMLWARIQGKFTDSNNNNASKI